MRSKQWYMNLLFIIGIPLITIGLTMFGVGLFMRRRALRSNKRNASRVYSDIDLEVQIDVEHNSLGPNFNRKERVRLVKENHVYARITSQKLSGDQIKFNNLIVENGIQTHSIVNNKIVYEQFMVSKYPKLHRHLIKLHRNQDRLHYNRK